MEMVNVLLPGFPATPTAPEPITLIIFEPSGPTGPPVFP
jgi:hypothetical protein